MNPKETDLLIKRYFDATATQEEEARLRDILADPQTESTPAVEEARAVMGYAAVMRAVRQPRPRRSGNVFSRIATASVAASLAAVVIAGWNGAFSTPADNVAVVYTQGRVINSTDRALDIMAAQLGAIGEASENSPAAVALKALESMDNNSF